MINAKEAVGLISADEANKQRYAAGSEFASSSEDAEVAKAKAKMQAQLDYEDAAKKGGCRCCSRERRRGE